MGWFFQDFLAFLGILDALDDQQMDFIRWLIGLYPLSRRPSSAQQNLSPLLNYVDKQLAVFVLFKLADAADHAEGFYGCRL